MDGCGHLEDSGLYRNRFVREAEAGGVVARRPLEELLSSHCMFISCRALATVALSHLLVHCIGVGQEMQHFPCLHYFLPYSVGCRFYFVSTGSIVVVAQSP